MRKMDFKMERQGLLKEGEKVSVTEGILPSSYYYTIDPSLAMSANYKLAERLYVKEGVVEKIEETPRGFYVTVIFDDEKGGKQ